MTDSNGLNIITQHGKWRVRAHADGRIEVESFESLPPESATAAIASVTQQQRSRMDSFREELQKRQEWLWANENKMSEDTEIRARARAILGMGPEFDRKPTVQPPALTAEAVEAMSDADLANLPEEKLRLVPEEKRPGLFARAASWLRAEASMVTDGALDDAAFNERMAACRGCEHLDRRDDPLMGFCKACGCGRNPRAELTIKGRMPKATCPKNKWPALPAK